jgi:hypothetical protein
LGVWTENRLRPSGCQSMATRDTNYMLFLSAFTMETNVARGHKILHRHSSAREKQRYKCWENGQEGRLTIFSSPCAQPQAENGADCVSAETGEALR